MVSISAVINTRNEEDNIGNCLKTLGWCDEIIVVDMESEDRTLDIAREFTDSVFTVNKSGYVESARKFAVEQANGDWILILDADEMISSTLAEALRCFAVENQVDIVEIPFKHYIMGACAEYTGWGYTPLPRFFRKGKIAFTDIIHNGMSKSDDAIVKRLENREEYCIHHFAYRDSVQFVNKLNRYTSIEAQHLFDKHEQFSHINLIISAIAEFLHRYLFGKGYREGARGFSLSIMMAFYRALTYIKLWELHEFHNESQEEIYRSLKKHVLDSWPCFRRRDT